MLDRGYVINRNSASMETSAICVILEGGCNWSWIDKWKSATGSWWFFYEITQREELRFEVGVQLSITVEKLGCFKLKFTFEDALIYKRLYKTVKIIKVRRLLASLNNCFVNTPKLRYLSVFNGWGTPESQ